MINLAPREINGVKNLIIAIVQDYRTGKVLMTAFMSEEALRKTLETGKAHYYSTSRKQLWLKGATSGNYQLVREVWLDCDGDAVLLKVEQVGNACHLGRKSCFHRKLKG